MREWICDSYQQNWQKETKYENKDHIMKQNFTNQSISMLVIDKCVLGASHYSTR